jgi:DNA ligase-1
VKLKAEESADLICVGVEKGAGKYANMIGNLICETSDGLLNTGVGTGLKDEDRSKDPSEFIGKIIEVAYNEVISSKGRDTKSLFLPVYKQIRFDKNVANSLKELK